jgi:hypothetical protein
MTSGMTIGRRSRRDQSAIVLRLRSCVISDTALRGIAGRKGPHRRACSDHRRGCGSIARKCQHHAPLACAVPVIRWGADASSDVLRQRARRTVCGAKGATLQHPGWGGELVGFLPFPVEH